MASLVAISPKGTVIQYDTSDYLGLDTFPTYIIARYSLWKFPTIKDMPLASYFDIGGGYMDYEILQNPVTGLQDGDSNDDYDDYDDYIDTYFGTVFSIWNLRFEQPVPVPDNFKLKFFAEYGGRWQQAMDNLFTQRNTADAPSISALSEEATLYGVPDLQGNRFLLATAVNAGFFLDLPKIAGITSNISETASFAPSGMSSINPFAFVVSDDAYNGADVNYFRNILTLSNCKVLLSHDYTDIFTGTRMTKYRLSLSNTLSYKYLNGTVVPAFVQVNDDLRNGLYEVLTLKLEGPHALTDDTYPYIALNLYNKFIWGELNNVNPEYGVPSDSIHAADSYIGYELHYRIFGIFHLQFYQRYYFAKNSKIDMSWHNSLSFYVSI
jgi:hypothetical protein